MSSWFMITLVGEDQANIVASVTKALFEGDCHLGESSMIRLGGNFTVMMMVQTNKNEAQLHELLKPVTDQLKLRLHVDAIKGHLHQHKNSDVRISLFCADRAGIVAQATGTLAEAGLNITDLESDVGGTKEKPIYIMHIEGIAQKGVEALEKAVEKIASDGIDIKLSPIDLLIG